MASKKVLAYLLELNPKDFTVEKVSTWKQWKKIDLRVEATIITKNGMERYALLIENKMYTHIRNGQLNRYQKIFNDHYQYESEFKPTVKKYLVLTCFHKECDYKIDLEYCKANYFDFRSFGWLKSQSDLTERTGNDLFDEFWFKYWKSE